MSDTDKQKVEAYKQNKPCIFNHADKLLLICRMQDDGTRYDYCDGCGWIN